MTLGGQQQKARMQCYCVKWRRVELHGTKPTKLIGLGELMLIDPPPQVRVPKVTRNQEIRNMPCRYYQKNSCSHKGDHEMGGKLYLHICSHCHSQGKNVSHSLKDCRKAKNK